MLKVPALLVCKLVKGQMDELRPESPSDEFERAYELLGYLMQYFDSAADPRSTMAIVGDLLLKDQGLLPLAVAEGTEVRKILEEKEFEFVSQLHSNRAIYRALVDSREYLDAYEEADRLKAKVEQGAARYLVEEAGHDWPDPQDSWSSWISEDRNHPGTPDS